MNLYLLDGAFAVCRLDPSARMPDWAMFAPFVSITRTTDELSIVVEEAKVPEQIKAERGWRCLKVEGPLDFAETGILASLAAPLAVAKISIFAVSTFDTDYLLIKEGDLESALHTLTESGHNLRD
ncbi:MAG TPA: ACT domain-containing protein [Blastocatellia bacterium]|nr:ACT domain-containing protein [Blastocatellia bacterium]